MQQLAKRVFGERRFHPFTLALSVACLTLGLLILTDQSVWGNTLDPWSGIVSYLSLSCAGMLWWGFWARSEQMTRHALILSACIFSGLAAYIGLVGGSWLTASLAFAWTIAAAGAWLVETSDPIPPEHFDHPGKCCPCCVEYESEG